MNDLKTRYIGAVLSAIPEKRRTDVARELATAIDDAVETRVEMGEDPGQALNDVLVDLGDPIRIAADYSDRPPYLIGPTYFVAWLRMLRLLLTIVVPFAGLGSLVVRLALAEVSPVEAILGSLWVAVIAALNVLFWVTLGFAVAERSEDAKPEDIAPLTDWSPERLPDVANRQFKVGEVVGSLVVIGLVIAAILAQRGLDLPFLNPDAWDLIIPVMLVLLVVSASMEVVKLKVGRWTKQLVVTNALLNTGYATWWVWAVVNGDLLNPAFFAELGWDPGQSVAVWVTVAVVVGVCVWSVIEGIVGLRRARLEDRALVG